MARTVYPGLTKTENARRAKYDYWCTANGKVGVCILIYSDWIPIKNPDDSVSPENDHSIYHIKDAHTGELIDIDTRKGGDIKRRAPVQMSWIH